MGDDVQGKHRAVHTVHRQADAIHGNRALVGNVAGQLRRGFDIDAHRAGILLHLHDLAQAIHVAADQMTAQPGGRCQGFFQVHLAAYSDLLEGGQRQGLPGHIRLKSSAGQRRDGQADAINGNGIPQLHIGKIQRIALDQQGHVAPLRGHGRDLAHGFNNAGKHGNAS